MSMYTEEAVDLRIKVKHFRILVIGRANAGKTTILKKVCNSIDDPEVFSPSGWKLDTGIVEGSAERGLHNIENQLIFKSNPEFVFHDSRGFESGSVDETEKVEAFIHNRAACNDISERLHAIWYCLPTDTNRPLLAAEYRFFNTNVAGNVPIIAVFTKFDGLISLAYLDLMREGASSTEAKKKDTERAQALLAQRFIQPLIEHSSCSELIEKTATAFTDEVLNRLFQASPMVPKNEELPDEDAAQPTVMDQPKQPPVLRHVSSLGPRLRILVVGKSGVGKTSLISSAFKISPYGHSSAQLDIEEEITFAQNPHFVLHDSRGFEPGEEEIFKKAKIFLETRSGAHVPREDRVHVIWLCIRVPFAGGRVFETGDEALVELASKANIPIIVVFTQFDLLISLMGSKLTTEESDMPEQEIDRLCFERADMMFEELCATPLHKINPSLRYTRTSVRNSYQDRLGVAPLVQITHNLVHSDVKDLVQLAFLFARQVGGSSRTETSYTQVESRAQASGGEHSKSRADDPLQKYSQDTALTTISITSLLHYIHFQFFNLRNPDNPLNSHGFIEQLKKLAQMVTPEASALDLWFSTNLGAVQHLSGIAEASPTIGVSSLTEIGLSPMFRLWFGSVTHVSREVCRFLAGYLSALEYVVKWQIDPKERPREPSPLSTGRLQELECGTSTRRHSSPRR
ncbi:hypothetical protein C8J57DRAFT_340106 [Mycena rebaudengoi]|nr:hypothetical protein C8J57DRAFT_340106 [Mycena rebaudengoi]